LLHGSTNTSAEARSSSFAGPNRHGGVSVLRPRHTVVVSVLNRHRCASRDRVAQS
jgi:hypothetical protein